MSNSAAALAEQRLHRRAQKWRVAAIDEDLQRALTGNVQLTMGFGLRNINAEFKSIAEGPIDLNGKQFEVLRATAASHVPPFAVQFTDPGFDQPWAFRVFPLRADALTYTDQRTWLLLSERDMEGWAWALTGGLSVSVETYTLKATGRYNTHPGPCIDCQHRVEPMQGALFLESSRGKVWRVAHIGCPTAEMHHDPTRPGRVHAELSAELDRYHLDYLDQSFDSRLPDDAVWPRVILPRSYATPAPVSPFQNGYLRLSGALDRMSAHTLSVGAPVLTLVHTTVDVEPIVTDAVALDGDSLTEAEFDRRASSLASRFVAVAQGRGTVRVSRSTISGDALALRRRSAWARHYMGVDFVRAYDSLHGRFL